MDKLLIFQSICLGIVFLRKITSQHICPILEVYDGCDCDRDDYTKFDAIFERIKRYRRDIQESYKMPYRYSKIYNATQAAWAYNVAGEDDPKKIWEDNDWEENDALVGFYSDDTGDFHNIIFCRPGYAIYVQTEDEKEKANFQYGDIKLRIPPVIIVNLNNAYDTDFLHSKVHPSEMDMDDYDSEDDECDCNDESDDSDSENDESDDSESTCETRLYSYILDNQRVIEFLYKCRDATDNQFKKAAYSKAINEIHNYWSPIYPQTWKPCTIGESIERKIREFLDGVCEEDIINS